MVDMPGYGFAYVKEETKEDWKKLIKNYITNRKTLRLLYVIIDARHGLKFIDKQFLETLKETNTRFRIVLTKCDLVQRSILARRYDIVNEEIQKQYANLCKKTPHLFSAVNKAGVNTVRKEILHISNLKIELMKQKEKNMLKRKYKENTNPNKLVRIPFVQKAEKFKHKGYIPAELLKTNIFNKPKLE